VRANLTVTLGLRWSTLDRFQKKNNKLATVVLGQGANVFTEHPIRTGGDFITPVNALRPQLGFAWSPKAFMGRDFANHLVLRGGMRGFQRSGAIQLVGWPLQSAVRG